MAPQLRITVVTPSFNQAAFLRDAIESVLSQGYPNLEYIVLDGGSTDGSVEIIREYAPRLAYWSSGPDGGQAAAINAGFARGTGSILGWLNSDDYYLPGTLRTVAANLDPERAQLLLGNCFHFHEGTSRCSGSDVPLRHQQFRLATVDYVIQPSSFWTRCAWDQTGPLNEQLRYVFDWEWFIRCGDAGVETRTTARYLSAYRQHRAHKSAEGGPERNEEMRGIYSRYSPPYLLQLHDDCLKHARALKLFRKWVSNFRLTKCFPLTTLLRWFFPRIFTNVPEKVLRDYLGLMEKSLNEEQKNL